MGLFNVIKLANDYNSAKKLLEKKNITTKDIENSIVKVQCFIIELRNFVNDLNSWISRAKELINKLNSRIPKGRMA